MATKTPRRTSRAIADRPLEKSPSRLPTTHAGPGRPAVKVDWELVGAYIRKGLPLADIAAIHRCSEETLRDHANREGIEINSLYQAKRAEGRDKLLDQIHAHAEKWGPMAIFLAKQPQWLGYSDTPRETQIRLEIRAIQIEALPATPRPAIIEGQVRELPPATPEAQVGPDRVQE